MSAMQTPFEGFVHVTAGALADGRGEPLLLRGVGLGNWLLPEGYMWKFPPAGPQSPREIEALIEDLVGPDRAAEFWRRFRSTFITEDDIARIRAEGMNHVRLPINSRIVLDDNGDLLKEGFVLIDRLIDWCRTHELWVVLDLHGAPGGQTGTNIDDSPNGVPELFSDGRYRQLTVGLWRAIAERYRNEPVVAAYDLLNEPLPDKYQGLYADDLVELYVDLTAVIREVDPHHLICYEGTNWATNWSIFTEVWDGNSMLQFHKYWSPPDRTSIQCFIDIGHRLGLPIYMGEGGENNLAWLQTAFQLYEDCGISWNFWPWKKIDTCTSPCSVNAPAGWAHILRWAAGTSARPDADQAWQALAGMLDALPLSRCTYRSEVISAVLRRVPLRIPAAGFGFRGAGVSYRSAAALPLRGFRSDDLVTIRHAGGAEPKKLDFHHASGEARSADDELLVSLSDGEWVAYDIGVVAPARLDLLVEVTAVGERPTGKSALDLSVDGTSADVESINRDTSIHAVTRGMVAPGRHVIRMTGRARETVIRSIRVMEPGAETLNPGNQSRLARGRLPSGGQRAPPSGPPFAVLSRFRCNPSATGLPVGAVPRNGLRSRGNKREETRSTVDWCHDGLGAVLAGDHQASPRPRKLHLGLDLRLHLGLHLERLPEDQRPISQEQLWHWLYRDATRHEPGRVADPGRLDVAPRRVRTRPHRLDRDRIGEQLVGRERP